MSQSAPSIHEPADTERANHGGPTPRLEQLQYAIEHAAHLLPAQGPITAFVHHNTLHAFEHLPFEQAVVEGARTFGCHPFLPEDRYREKLARGRIRPEDIEAVLIEDLGDEADVLLGFLGTRFSLRRAMLQHPLRTGPTVELRWVIAETEALRRFHEEAPGLIREKLINDTRRWIMRDLRNGKSDEQSESDWRIREIAADVFDRFDKPNVEGWAEDTWESFCLHLLWLVCRDGLATIPPPEVSPDHSRHRDWLKEATGQDSDLLVHDVLIRFCAAFIDQGFGDWPVPKQDHGLFHSFLSLYAPAGGPPDRWLRGLRKELSRIQDAGLTPLECIDESLTLLGVGEAEVEPYIAQSLLALRGYAGMIWQIESRGDRVAVAAPSGSLVEFLAVRLILERLAVGHLSRERLRYDGALSGLRKVLRDRCGAQQYNHLDQRTYLIFQLAQLLGWSPEALHRLPEDGWSMLVSEVEAFSSLERRRTYQLAFECHYRNQTLDAVVAHNALVLQASETVGAKQIAFDRTTVSDSSRRPQFQLVCCIDEREESFRRHLEEVAPDCETLGAAGFFAVAMNYRGAAEAHYTPLCPVMITPQHYVKESVVHTFKHAEHRRQKHRRTIGTVTHRVHIGSRTFVGGWLAAVFGSLASIPLVMRILFPRATAQFRGMVGGFVRTPVVTQLQLERTEATPGSEEGHVGYSVGEMAVVVERLLRDIGMTKNYSRLVFITGHGSSSLNNPHEAAHDCGACSGGRGGPNARAFSHMANDPRVREILASNSLPIPSDTIFVGTYHNTCDDSMAYYDVEKLPATHSVDLEVAIEAIDQARERNAHERCRRFESAELNLSTEAALRHVEGRAEDLSQVRPEFGHATNALCFVGRRSWSRGMFLDRRAFLQSYEPSQDDDNHTILNRILQAVIPVCAGINLEYYFSYVDPTGYGCGTKLPHNIASLLGVMNGAASDLQPGLPWQMVEIHEPVRLLFVIETSPEAMLQIMKQNEGMARLCLGGWVQLATLDSATNEINLFRKGSFELYRPESHELPSAKSSVEWYRGWRDHLGFASIG